ncbi:MAG: hypothetical protein EBX50_22115, partial [Chitinophagia bacterium]|nr:hypothetical protein [Chitinophagia bacterium]
TLNLANALISVADALKPIIPLITAFAAVKFASNIGSFFGAIGGAFTRRQFGGPIRKFASGGLVPGAGNGDTVPAMLTPGEFVIRKSSVKKMGAGRLAAMNENRYAEGGNVIAKLGKTLSKTKVINSKNEPVGFNKDTYDIKGGSEKIKISYDATKRNSKDSGFRANNTTKISKKNVNLLFNNDRNSAAVWETIVAKVKTGKLISKNNYPIDVIKGNDTFFDAKFREEETYKDSDALKKALSHRLYKATGQKFDYQLKNNEQYIRLNSILGQKLKTTPDNIKDSGSITFVYPEFENIPKDLESIQSGVAEREKQVEKIGRKKRKSESEKYLLKRANAGIKIFGGEGTFTGTKKVLEELRPYSQNFFGGAIQKFVKGGKAKAKTRNLGYIDSDVLADPANAL